MAKNKRRSRRHGRTGRRPIRDATTRASWLSRKLVITLAGLVISAVIGIIGVWTNWGIAKRSGALNTPDIQFELGSLTLVPDSMQLVTTFVPDSLRGIDVITQIPIGVTNRGLRTLRGVTLTTVLPVGSEEDTLRNPISTLVVGRTGDVASLRRSTIGQMVFDATRIPDLNPGGGLLMYYPVRVNSVMARGHLVQHQPIDILVRLDATDYQRVIIPIRLLVIGAADTAAYMDSVGMYLDRRRSMEMSSMSTLEYLRHFLRPRTYRTETILPEYGVFRFQIQPYADTNPLHLVVREYDERETRWGLVKSFLGRT